MKEKHTSQPESRHRARNRRQMASPETWGLCGSKENIGTTLKFTPVTSTDTMVKSGVSTNVNTRHLVISAMKEYENKSFEELRIEDYTANRKGPSSTGLLSQGMTQVDNKAGGLFGQSTAMSDTELTCSQIKPIITFGTGTQSAFGNTSSSLFGVQQQTQQAAGLFGQKAGFGTTGNTGLGFGDKSTSAFGQTRTKSLFGQPTGTSTQSMSLFGSTPASGTTGFATGSTFGGTTRFGQTRSSSLFGKPLGFGTTTTSTGLTLGSGTSTGLFGQQSKPGLSLGTGGTSGFEHRASRKLSRGARIRQAKWRREISDNVTKTDTSETDTSETYTSPTDTSPTYTSPTYTSPTDTSETDTSETDTSETDTSETDTSETDTSEIDTSTGFGTTATQSTGLFGNKGATAGFGGLGTGLGGGLGTGFGTSSTGSSLFGGATSKPATLGGFGATNPTGTGFGTNASQSTSVFGNTSPFTQMAVADTSQGLFGEKTKGSSNNITQSGTTVKFCPVTSTDTMVKSGVATDVNTRHLVISAMKEYENKSFEELRLEDYTTKQFDAYQGLIGNSIGGWFLSTKSGNNIKVKPEPPLGSTPPLNFSQHTTSSSESLEEDDLIKSLKNKKAQLERAIKARELQDDIDALEAKLSDMNTKDLKPDKTSDALSIGAAPLPCLKVTDFTVTRPEVVQTRRKIRIAVSRTRKT